MSTVLCWDIDGTLLTTGRAGIFALEEAASEVIGQPVDLTELKTAGLTDVSLAQEILTVYGVPADQARVTRLLHLYGTYLPKALPRRQGRVMPGVLELLEVLRSHPHIHSLLLTGNIQAGAQAKLSYYGLDGYFSQGAFSDQALDRPDIARQAFTLAQSLVADLHPDRVYVIGDTPHDIHCGKAIQARTIAIATGTYSQEQLEAHQPWWLLAQLPSPEIFLEKILGDLD